MSSIEDAGTAAVSRFSSAAAHGVDAATDVTGGTPRTEGESSGAGLDAAKGALGAVGGMLGAGTAASGATISTGTGTGGALPPLSSRLDAGESRDAGPSIFLPILGVVALGALAYVGWYTISKGDGTLFPERVAPPAAAVVAPPAPAVVAPTLPAWLSAIGDKLKSTFAWLTLGTSGSSVIASGQADNQAAKDNVLKELALAVKAAPEGASSDIIDNITVKGSAATPVGSALAVLGAAPTAAACNTAFASTMAGRTINFSTGGASIGGDNASLLNTLTAVANVCKAHQIEVAGHTDSVGEPPKNQALSQKRADAVKSYWTAKGVAAGGLVAKGYGETKPIEPTADETANENNRRITFTVSDAAAAAPVVAAEPAK